MATLDFDEIVLVDDAGAYHLVIEVIALARALADAGEHRQARVGRRDVVDELHHRHGLADAGAAEQAHFAALGKRAAEVDHLDAGLEQFLRRRQLVERRRVAVDRHLLFSGDRAPLVDRPAQHVHDAAERLATYRHHDGVAGVDDNHSAAQSVGAAERDRAHDAVAQLLLHLERQPDLVHLERVVDLRHLIARELHVDDRADALNDGSLIHIRIPTLRCLESCG